MVVLVVAVAVPVLATESARRGLLAAPLRELGGSEFAVRMRLRSPQGPATGRTSCG